MRITITLDDDDRKAVQPKPAATPTLTLAAQNTAMTQLYLTAKKTFTRAWRAHERTLREANGMPVHETVLTAFLQTFLKQQTHEPS